MNDPLAAGAVAGIIGLLFKLVLEWVLSSARLMPAISYHYIVTLILPSEEALPLYVRIIAFVFSEVGSSSFFGVILAYLLIRTGRDLWFLKAVGFAAVLFIIHVSLIPKMWEPQLVQKFANPTGVLGEVVWVLIWSTVTAHTLVNVFKVTQKL